MKDYQQALCHLVGDYLFQTDAMAIKKTKSLWWAAFHAATYTIPFLTLTRDPKRLAIIFGTHTLIDRYRLAKYVIALKNSSTNWAQTKEFFSTRTGFSEKTPPYMSDWLFIISDNCIHLLLNYLALQSAEEG